MRLTIHLLLYVELRLIKILPLFTLSSTALLLS